MPEAGLNKTPWTKSIVAPSLNSLALSAHPVSEEIATIRIGPVGVSIIRVENSGSVVGVRRAGLEITGKIRVASFDSKIQFIELGHLCQVKPRPNRGIPPVRYGGKLVFDKRLCVKFQPIFHAGYSKGK